jgi:dolichyl-phosphate beta-glucosyltransferase
MGGRSAVTNPVRDTGDGRATPSLWWGAVLPIVFVLYSGRWFAAILAGPGAFGYDARLYAIAARAMLEGRDPYAVDLFGGIFAGPPTSLVPLLPFAYLPQEVVATTWMVGNLVLAVLVLRRLRLPAWWLAFPPLFFPIVMGSVELLMLGLLVMGGPLRGLSVVVKPYAGLPLLAERLWRHLALGAAAVLLTFALLPWDAFFADLPRIQAAFSSQAFGSNATADPRLVVISILALASLGLRRALWLATPVLSPIAAIHYAAMTLPVLPPLLALFWAIQVPGAVVAGIVVLAVSERIGSIYERLSRAAAHRAGTDPRLVLGASGGVAAVDQATRLRPMPAKSLTLVLPAFNEADRIEPALDELFGYLRRRGQIARDGAPGSALLPDHIEVLVVDDGSSDATAELVRARPEAQAHAAVPELRVLSVPHGGKGAAVRAGMLAATTDLIVFTDADMATPPDQVPLLVEALETNDVALGSRIQPDGSDMRKSQPWYRRMLGRAFHLLASIWVVGPVKDTQCGFKGFTRAAAHDLFARQRIESIVFDVELIFLVRRRGYRFAVVPIRWSDRRGSRMQPRPSLAVRVAWDLFRIPLIHRGLGRAAPAMTGSEEPGDG